MAIGKLNRKLKRALKGIFPIAHGNRKKKRVLIGREKIENIYSRGQFVFPIRLGELYRSWDDIYSFLCLLFGDPPLAEICLSGMSLQLYYGVCFASPSFLLGPGGKERKRELNRKLERIEREGYIKVEGQIINNRRLSTLIRDFRKIMEIIKIILGLLRKGIALQIEKAAGKLWMKVKGIWLSFEEALKFIGEGGI